MITKNKASEVQTCGSVDREDQLGMLFVEMQESIAVRRVEYRRASLVHWLQQSP